MAVQKKRGPLNYPIGPSLLSELNAFEDTPFPAGDFRPEENWTNYYRLWTSYGYYDRNRDDGHLKISRQAKSTENGYKLLVEQDYINLANRKHENTLLHKTSATITCKNNETASPVSWDLTSEFLNGPENIEQFERAEPLREKVIVKNDELIVTVNDKTHKRKVSGNVTGDWNLFNAVQLFPFDKSIDIKFDLLEGLRAFRQNHYLYYKGKAVEKWGAKTVALHCFEQIGEGVLPYEYWLNEHHRLVLVITGNRAYILKETS